MDVFDDKFIPALRSQDFKTAAEVLEEWKKETSYGMYMWAKSRLFFWMNQKVKSNGILSDVIDSGSDDGKICQETRANNYLNEKQYQKSLKDFNAILEDNAPKVVEMYHSNCLFKKAYIFAVLGDHDFNDVINKIADDEESFITNAIYDKASLIKIYNATKSL